QEPAQMAEMAKIAVPENLAAIIDHYIAGLGTEERWLLSAAAVCGLTFRIPTLPRTLQHDAASVGFACDELVRAQVWLLPPPVSPGSESAESHYGFRHALFRQVLYDRTSAPIRAELHRKVGRALERERADGLHVAAGELAMHFERARDTLPAVRYWVEAAEDALARLRPAECMSLTDHASNLLQHAPEGPERTALEISLLALRGLAATHVLRF